MSPKPLSVFYLIRAQTPSRHNRAHATTVVSGPPYKFVTLMTVSVCHFCCSLEIPHTIFLYLAELTTEKLTKKETIKGPSGQITIHRPETCTVTKAWYKRPTAICLKIFNFDLEFFKGALCYLVKKNPSHPLILRSVNAQTGLFSDKPVSKNAQPYILCLEGGLVSLKKDYYIKSICRKIRRSEEFLY
jgi:hypothetical protein